MDLANITKNYETGRVDALLGRAYRPTGSVYSDGFNGGVCTVTEELGAP